MPVFVDTNVLVYARDAGQGAKQVRAAQWIDELWASRAGRLSFQVLYEFYVTVTQKLRPAVPRDDAQADVRDLTLWRPLAPDISQIEAAWEIQARFGLSFWDALIVAAAKTTGCDRLLTEDLTDGQDLDGLRVVNPFTHEP